MIVKHLTDVPAQEVEQGAIGVTIRWLLAEPDGAPHFAMRHFAIAPGGHTPHHTHEWEHEVFILSGSGTATGPHGDTPLEAGSVVLVEPNEEHHFTNHGAQPLTFLCLIPHRES